MSKCYKSVVEAAQGIFIAGCLILFVVLSVLVMWGISIAIGDCPITFLVVVICIFLASGLIVAYDEHKTKKEIKRLHDALLDRMQTPEQKAGIKAAFDKLTQNQERGE